MSDAEFLAGRSSSKESDKMNWINMNSWNLHKAFRHNRETRINVLGFGEASKEREIAFDEYYKDRYPENHKILNNE